MGWIGGGLESEPYDRTYPDRELIRRIVHYFGPERRPMLIAGAAIFLNSAFEAAIPIIVSAAIDIVAARLSLGTIAAFGAAVLVLQATAWVANYFRQVNASRAIGNVVLSLRADVFAATAAHDLSFYDAEPSGKIVSRITSDTEAFGETADLTMNLLSEILSVGIISAVVFVINYRLSLLMLAFTPIVFGIALSFRHVARRVTLNARRVLAKVNANIQESVSGIAIAKGFRQEATMHREFLALNAQSFRVGLTRGLVLNLIWPILSGGFAIATAAVLYAGGVGALQNANPGAGTGFFGTVTVGQWFLFMQAMGYFWFPMTRIASFWSQFQDGLSAAERVFSLIDAEPQVVQTDSRPVPQLRGRIEIDDVTFGYNEGEVVIPHLNLTIEAGETLALVGHTGSGKTSIARLLARFYEFQDGRIRIDGHDIRTFDLAAYRRQLGLVPQSPFLFTGSVRDNIRYSKPDATDEEVATAAAHVGDGEWLADLSDGLDTDVGERGGRLSMGQRQLVALARVLLQNPAIFILDEATSNVDPFTERQIQQGLQTVMAGRTSIVIAHRLSTVVHADRIIVMQDGRIIQEGTHEGLLAQGGHYAELYNTYFRHQSLEYVERSRELLQDVAEEDGRA